MFECHSILSFCILSQIRSSLTDCGVPAIPFNAQIDSVRNIYYEGDSVEYQCQPEDLKLLGDKTRKCQNSQWVGAVPRCVEELTYGTIEQIEIADRKNHTLDFHGNWYRYYQKAAYYGDSSRNKCLSSKGQIRGPHSWKLHLTNTKRHISYIEIVISDNDKTLPNTLVRSAKVNELRECSPQAMRNDTAIRVNLTCQMAFDGDSMFEAWERDQTKMITIDFDDHDITICEIRIYTNSFMPFHRCGSPDTALHGKIEFIKSSTKYGRDPYYEYTCDEGFQLSGPSDVICGLNNVWVNSFPTCKPQVTCPIPTSKTHDISTETSFDRLFSFDGNITAVIGSIVTYQCTEAHGNDSVMIGDSVRMCGKDGQWSGVEPICLRSDEITLNRYESIKEAQQKSESLQKEIIINDTLLCGVPAMPLFAKPTSSKSYQIYGSQPDIRHEYSNGTVVYYQCESAYRWITGDVAERTCVNGLWRGKIGKCAINWGDRFSLYSIHVYDEDKKGQWVDDHYITPLLPNETTNWDQHFAYRRDPTKGSCATFATEGKIKWVLMLNQSTSITFFTVMYHPGGFFGNKRKINDRDILEKSPITADIGNRNCELTSAWDYTHSRVGTFFFFTCDIEEPRYNRGEYYDRNINIYIDPKRFPESYTAKNISLCALAIMSAKDECGTPDIPLHSYIHYDKSRQEVTLTCEDGYELVGPSKVKCGRHGRWMDSFPICRRSKLCHNDRRPRIYDRLSIEYANPFIANNTLCDNSHRCNDFLMESDTIATYSCISTKEDLMLLGPRTRSCISNGKWSGTEPNCVERSSLPSIGESKRSSSATMVFMIVSFATIGFVSIIGCIIVAYKRGLILIPNISIPKFSIPKINIESATPSSSIRRDASEVNINNNEPKVTQCNINEEFPVFSNGTEFLVEPDTQS